MSKNRINGNNYTKEQMNHYSNQHNPNSSVYKSNNDNHSNQLKCPASVFVYFCKTGDLYCYSFPFE